MIQRHCRFIHPWHMNIEQAQKMSHVLWTTHVFLSFPYLLKSETQNRGAQFCCVSFVCLFKEPSYGCFLSFVSCSWYQTTKPPILFSPIFYTNVWTNEKFIFFFISSNWEKFVEKIEGNKIRRLVVWCHEQDIAFLNLTWELWSLAIYIIKF